MQEQMDNVSREIEILDTKNNVTEIHNSLVCS